MALLAPVLVPLLPACAGAAGAAVAPPAAPAPLPRGALHGVAVQVQDGDTFDLRAADGRRFRVRLAGIDAPERGQPFADQARRRLRELLHGVRVRLDPIKRDPFDRLVARAWARPVRGPEIDVSLALVQAGLAWHFTRYRADQTADEFDRYARAQEQARQARAGLWLDPAPEAPWALRERTRRAPAAPAPPAPRSGAG